jgi:hypothetical protein
MRYCTKVAVKNLQRSRTSDTKKVESQKILMSPTQVKKGKNLNILKETVSAASKRA